MSRIAYAHPSKAFLPLGATVHFCARADVEIAVEELKRDFPGTDVYGYTSDNTDHSQRQDLIKAVTDKVGTAIKSRHPSNLQIYQYHHTQSGGRLDVLVNNTGTNIRKPTADFSREEVRCCGKVEELPVFCVCHPPLISGSPAHPRRTTTQQFRRWTVCSKRTFTAALRCAS